MFLCREHKGHTLFMQGDDFMMLILTLENTITQINILNSILGFIVCFDIYYSPV